MKKNEEKCVLDMTSMEARAFFLKSSSYFSGNLPTYFDFTSILNEVSKIMDGKKLNDVWYRKPGNYRNVNRKIIMNKDGKYAWRQLQIIHPFIYVDLVNLITEEKNWNLVRKRFSEFDNTSNASKIRCISIPKQSKSKLSDIGNTILGWWKNSEQALIKYSLDFDYCLQTDVTDCYPSIYTHSISWALHGINVAKSNNGAINQAILAIKPNPGYSSDFIMNYLKKEKDNILEKYLQGGQGNLSAAIVKSIELSLPSQDEQSAIGSLFRSLDDLLASYKDNLANYQSLKATMLSKMFPKVGQTVPEIRLDGFEGEWVEKRLKDVSKRVTRKNNDLVSERALTISAQFGLIDQEEFFQKKIASKDVSGYYLMINCKI